MLGKAVGLLFKKSIDKDYMMIFDMGENSNWEFHTHMMKFPMDMISVIENGNGQSCVFETYSHVRQGSRIILHGKYIIEAQAGFVKRRNIKMGEKISWKSIASL